MKVILALDLSSKVGWAVRDAGGSFYSGVVKLPKTGEDVGWFLDDWRRSLTRLIPPDCGIVLFEQPILPTGTSIATLRKLYGMAGLTEMICRDVGVTCKEVPMQKWRKHWLGQAAAPKDVESKKRRAWLKQRAMEKCAEAGIKVGSDDEADAVGVLMFGVHALG